MLIGNAENLMKYVLATLKAAEAASVTVGKQLLLLWRVLLWLVIALPTNFSAVSMIKVAIDLVMLNVNP